jgi:hypothetical protein
LAGKNSEGIGADCGPVHALKIVLVSRNQNIVIIKTFDEIRPTNMTTKIAVSLLSLALLGACTTTSTTATKRQTLREMEAAAYASNDTNSLNEPPPPAEGPEDVPAEGPAVVMRNPGLVPTPLLRDVAASHP